MNAPVRKIAFVLPNFQAGGAERVMITVANHLDRARFQPVFIVCRDYGPLRGMVAADTLVISLNRSCSWPAIPALAAAVKSSGASLAISTMAHLNILMLLAKPFLGGVPVIVREAVTPSYFSDSLFKRTVLTLAYYLLYPFADRILSPTQMAFDEMPALLRGRKALLTRIFNPVDASFIQDALAENVRDAYVRPGQRLFVGAGRLVDQKGFDRLIAVLKDWCARDDWRLVILGEGPEHARLQQLIHDHGLHQITLAGFDAQPWRIFAAADAFVLPSRHEGLPNVVLEALSLGTPVIAAASAGGIDEIAAVVQDGAVVIAQDMDEFTALMNQVTAGTDIIPRRSRLPACFSLPDVVASYEQLFADILSGKR